MRRGTDAKVTLHVGKDGITDAWIAELGEQVRRRAAVKVRVLPSARGERSLKEFAAGLAARIGARVVDVRGFTIVFAKEPRAGQNPKKDPGTVI